MAERRDAQRKEGLRNSNGDAGGLGRIHFAVIGIGINVNNSKMPAELAGIATSLRTETRRVHSRLKLLVRLLRHLDRDYNHFIADGAAPVVSSFAQVSSYVQGKRMRITNGQESYIGTTAGLEPSGILRVQREDGRIESVISGTVSEAL